MEGIEKKNKQGRMPTEEEVAAAFEPKKEKMPTEAEVAAAFAEGNHHKDDDKIAGNETAKLNKPRQRNKKAVVGVVIVVALIVVGIVCAVMNATRQQKKPVVSVDELSEEQKARLGIDDENNKNESDGIDDENNYTDEYKKYLELSDEEKANLEVIPRKEVVPDDVLDEIRDDTDKDTLANIPKKFDLRDIINVTVGDQGQFGLCWDYASQKALETHMKLKRVDYDPSELQIDFLSSDLMYGERTLHEGGNFQYFADMASSIGTISEGKFASMGIDQNANYYSNSSNYNYFKLAENEAPIYVTKTVNFPSLYKKDGKVEGKTDEEIKEFRDLVKAHIMTNGALYMVMDVPDFFVFKNMDGGKIQYYYTPDSSHSNSTRGSHAMAIVGWDDNFSKDNFVGPSKPTHDGAYLVLNSWGNWWGEDGYFYVSYDEYNVESQLSGVVSTTFDNMKSLDSVPSQFTKDLIGEKLGFYIVEQNGEKYISDYALEKVSYLDLSSRNLTDEDLASVADVFSNVSSLDISDNNISDISPIKKMNNLSSVYISHNNISDISPLCNTDAKYGMDISYNKIKDIGCLAEKLEDATYLDISGNEGITGFEGMSHLKTLYADNIGIDSLEDFRNMKELNSLSVQNNNIRNLDGLDVSGRTIYWLNISGNKIESLKTDSRVNSLDVSNNNLEDISILNDAKTEALTASNNNFRDLSEYDNDSVKTLNLSGNKNMYNFAKLNGVENLNLSGCEINSLSELGEIKSLKTLQLYNNNIESFNDADSSPDLVSLEISRNNLSSLDGIDKLENLQYLNIMNNSLTSLDGIGKLKNLQNLNAENNKIVSIDDVSKLDEMGYLYLDNNLVEDAMALEGLENLRFVSLSKNNITTIPNFSEQTYLSIALEDNPIESAEIPSATQYINLKNCGMKTMDYSRISASASLNLAGNPEWNDYEGLMSMILLRKNYSENTSYSSITTDHVFSKNEMSYFLGGKDNPDWHSKNWNISLTEYQKELNKNETGAVDLEDNPEARHLMMVLVKSSLVPKEIAVDKAAKKIMPVDSSIDSVEVDKYFKINDHFSANSIKLLFVNQY